MIFYSQCDAWLNNNFKVSGDHIPNMDQIHLEAQEKSAIWNYYSSHIDSIFMEEVLCYSFIDRMALIWRMKLSKILIVISLG